MGWVAAAKARCKGGRKHVFEGHERGLFPAAFDQERVEVAAAVVLKYDRLTVDHRLVHRQAANRIGDSGESIREVGAAAAPDLDALALLPGEDAEAVMLDLVQPAGSSGREVDAREFARTKGSRQADFGASGAVGRARS